MVRAHVAEGRCNATLRGDGVGAGGEDLGDAGGLQTGLGDAHRGAQPGPAGTDNDGIIDMIDDLIGFGHQAAPRAILSTANTAAAAPASV